MTSQLRSYLAGLFAWQRDDLAMDKYFEVAKVAEQFGVTADEVQSLARELNKPTPERFEWLAAVNTAAGKQAISQKALAVAVALFGTFNDKTPYAWPNQRTLAAACGWNQTRGVRDGLLGLERIGAVTRIAASNLPVEVAAQVFGAKSTGGSGRDRRSMAYRRNDPKVWHLGNSGTIRSANNRNDPFHLNYKDKPQLASQDSFTNSGVSITDSEHEENLNNLGMDRFTKGGQSA